MPDELRVLRGQIAEVDRQLLHLAARRLALAAQVGELKKQHGIPLRDYDVEQRVLQNAEQNAAELAVPTTLARGLLQLLIGESRAHQERLTYSEYAGEHEDILVVGAAGKMGRWFVDFFRNQGHAVWTCDSARPTTQDSHATTLEAGLSTASIVLLATPLDTIPAQLDQLAAARFPGIVCDIASLKGHLRDHIHAAREAGLALTSLHPMFGPSTTTLADKVICICDCGVPAATARIENLFRDTAATLVKLSLERHDQIITEVLGLSHFANLLFAGALRASGLTYDELRSVGSTTFQSQMQTTTPVLHENPDLYYAIQQHNLNSPQLYTRLRRTLDNLSTAVLHADRDAFVNEMNAARQWLHAAGEQP